MKMNELSSEYVHEGQTLTILLAGRLNGSTVTSLSAEIEQQLTWVKLLYLDMEGLEYMSSAGLRLIIQLQKTMNNRGGKMVLHHVREEIMDVFAVTGFLSFLNVE